jgi:hypothetical protein
MYGLLCTAEICSYLRYTTGCPTPYQTQHFFNNFTTNEDIATKSEADLLHCVRNVKEKNVLLFKFRCNIFIGFRIIKELPGLVASGTPCIIKCCVPTVCVFIVACFQDTTAMTHCKMSLSACPRLIR